MGNKGISTSLNMILKEKKDEETADMVCFSLRCLSRTFAHSRANPVSRNVESLFFFDAPRRRLGPPLLPLNQTLQERSRPSEVPGRGFLAVWGYLSGLWYDRATTIQELGHEDKKKQEKDKEKTKACANACSEPVLQGQDRLKGALLNQCYQRSDWKPLNKCPLKRNTFCPTSQAWNDISARSTQLNSTQLLQLRSESRRSRFERMLWQGSRFSECSVQLESTVKILS
jgi:hypothetical protein